MPNFSVDPFVVQRRSIDSRSSLPEVELPEQIAYKKVAKVTSPKGKGKLNQIVPPKVPKVPEILNEKVEKKLEENVVDNVEVNFLFNKGMRIRSTIGAHITLIE